MAARPTICWKKSQAKSARNEVLVAQASACGVPALQGLNPHRLKPVLLKAEPDGHNFSSLARPRIPENAGAGHTAVPHQLIRRGGPRASFAHVRPRNGIRR